MLSTYKFKSYSTKSPVKKFKNIVPTFIGLYKDALIF